MANDYPSPEALAPAQIEAKAETNLRAKSLKSYIDRFNPRKALRVSMSKRSSGKRIDDYPLYAIAEAIGDMTC